MKDYPYMYGELKVLARQIAMTAKSSVQYNPKFLDGTGIYEDMLNRQANSIIELLEKHETSNR